MQNFKSFLSETFVGPIDFAPWHLRKKSNILKALREDRRNNVNLFSILENGTLNTNSSAVNFYCDKEQLPVHFNEVEELTIRSNSLTNIWGAPIKADALILKCSELKSLNHLYGKYDDLCLYCNELEEFNCNVNVGYIFIQYCKKFNAKDFSKSFYSDSTLFLNFGAEVAEKVIVDTPLLSLLITKNFTRITYNGNPVNAKLQDLAVAMGIISEHANSDADILDCQEELITNGLKTYAKL